MLKNMILVFGFSFFALACSNKPSFPDPRPEIEGLKARVTQLEEASMKAKELLANYREHILAIEAKLKPTARPAPKVVKRSVVKSRRR